MWVRVRPHSVVAPMWKFYKAPPQWEPKEYRPTCDILDAQDFEKMVFKLPERHREALRWRYVYGGSPLRACKALGLSYDGLHRHVRDGRQMVINLTAGSGI